MRTFVHTRIIVAVIAAIVLAHPGSVNAEAELAALMLQFSELSKSGETKAAAELIDQVLERWPDNAKAHFERGGIYGQRAQQASFMFAAGLAHQSLSSFQKAVELEPNNPDYRFGLMSFYLQAPRVAGGNKKLAEEQLTQLEALDEALGYRARAEWFQHTNREKQLAVHYNKATDIVLRDPQFVFKRAMYYQSEQDFARAYADLEHILTLSNEESGFIHAAAQYQLGRTSVFSKTRLQSGVQHLRSYIETAPLHAQLPEKDWAKFRLAQLHGYMGEVDNAMAVFDELASKTKDTDLKKAIKRARKDINAANAG